MTRASFSPIIGQNQTAIDETIQRGVPLSRKVKAITFDLWDTIIDDDSDEPKRKASGLRSKAAERRHVVWQAICRERSIPEDTVRLAYDVSEAAFNNLWRQHSITWTLQERLGVILKGLGCVLSEESKTFALDALGRMEIDIAPDPIDGIKDALDRLAGRYKLCIVSDAIVTPGVGLRELLGRYGLKDYFSGFAFSDEVGRSKPHRRMFESAADQLGVSIPEMLHVGDRDHNDVKGPQALGMKAVLFVGKRTNDRDSTSADAICERHADLPRVIDALAG